MTEEGGREPLEQRLTEEGHRRRRGNGAPVKGTVVRQVREILWCTVVPHDP
jgi:hypothetical protein